MKTASYICDFHEVMANDAAAMDADAQIVAVLDETMATTNKTADALDGTNRFVFII